jgi:hypothetical protein
LFFVLSACNRYLDVDKEYILHNFTPEEINFFWETAFSNDDEYANPLEDKQFILKKWNTDIRIHTFGELIREDSTGLENAILEINRLNLPVKIYWDKEKKDSTNFEMHFGTDNNLGNVLCDKSISFNAIDNIAGFEILIDNNKHCQQHTFIGIISNRLPHQLKPFIILHEIVNSLGLHGDSFSYMESVLNDSAIPDTTILRKHLSDMDKRILSLLYSPAIPDGISRDDFYKAFSDILPKRNKVLESDYTDLINYITTNRISEDIINTFYNQGFTSSVLEEKPHVSKWATHPVIHFSDSINPYSQKIIRDGVSLFNPLLPEKQKIIFQPHDTFPYNVCINNHGKNFYADFYDSKGIQTTNVSIGDIPFSEDKDRQNRITAKVMMELLGGAYRQDREFPKAMATQVCHPDYIRFFLSPAIQSGMKQEKIKNSLREYYKIDKQLKKAYKELDAYLSKKPLSDTGSNCLIQLLSNPTIDSGVIHKWDSLKIGVHNNPEKQVQLLNPNISTFYVISIMPMLLSSSAVFLVDSVLCQSLLILTFFSSERNRNKS